jgi:GNAT superfamily N-acetyltransferase
MLDDPTAPALYRVSGAPPYPLPFGAIPADITIRQVTLRDRVTIATLVPFSSPTQVPHRLTAYLCELLNREIEKGDTYPMMEPMPLSSFGPYWFANFGAVMILGDIQSGEDVRRMEERGVDWARECLGSFYVKPNYPGRSSHVCNGGFLVTDAARNRGVGRLMGEGYLEWAPKLGYTYSVFNLVYETNVASLRIWDALGFKRIGRVKGCGNLKSYPDQFVDAIIFGRELGGEGDEYVSEERFDKIRFYLKTGTYPAGSDRAEKSRLRSAATHYRLVPNPAGHGGGQEDDEILMLKGKEVVSDPNKQYEIARDMHAASHGGINKTTASIAEKYHWVRIKETVSAAIRNCSECKDSSVMTRPAPPAYSQPPKKAKEPSATARQSAVVAGADSPDLPSPASLGGAISEQEQQAALGAESSAATDRDLQHGLASSQHVQHQVPMANMQYTAPQLQPTTHDYGDLPVDPQLVNSWPPSRAYDANAMVLEHHQQHHQLPPEPQQGSLVHELMKASANHDTHSRQVNGADADHKDDEAQRQFQAELEAHIMSEASVGQAQQGQGRGRVGQGRGEAYAR